MQAKSYEAIIKNWVERPSIEEPECSDDYPFLEQFDT